jgi:hypothetical protein
MKKLFLLLTLLFSYQAYSQSKSLEKAKIEKTIIDFLKWYEIYQADTTYKEYKIIKGGYPDSTTQRLIDFDGLEKYLKDINEKNILSPTFLNELRRYFYHLNEEMKLIPPQKELNAIPGLGTDLILSTFEPEEILKNLDKGKFDKISIIYNKALARFKIKKGLELLFVLTRVKENWLIDYIDVWKLN